jgi:hypothetical protein
MSEHKSGRETLSFKDRQDILRNEVLWLQMWKPEFNGNNGSEVHGLNSLIGNARACASADNGWTRAHISKVELEIMAYRRGGYPELQKVARELYPMPWLDKK